MVHEVEPTLSFDLAKHTFISSTYERKLRQSELLAIRARALERREEDLKRIKTKVIQVRFKNAEQFKRLYENTIKDYDCKPGTLVLVRNTRIEAELNRKSKSRYLGSMVVVRRTKGGAYILSKLSKAISNLRYAAFRIISYHPRSAILGTLKNLLEKFDLKLDQLTHEGEVIKNDERNDEGIAEDLEESDIDEFEEDEE